METECDHRTEEHLKIQKGSYNVNVKYDEGIVMMKPQNLLESRHF